MSGLLTIPFEQYVAMEGVNWSSLGYMRESPLHYQHALNRDRSPTPEQSTGTAAHAAILEPDVFANFASYTGDGTRASREYKLFAAVATGRFDAEWAAFSGPGSLKTKAGAAFAEANPGKRLCTWDEWCTAVNAVQDAGINPSPSVVLASKADRDAAVAMRDAVMAHATAGPLFRQGLGERSFQWVDAATGLLCKGRTDWLTPADGGGYHLVDLKTSRTADPRMFGRDAAKYGYHNQIAHYDTGLAAVGVRIASRMIVVVESSAPYDVVVYVVMSDQLEKGRAENAELLARVSECRESGRWPGRFSAEVPLDLPAYVMGDDEITGLDFGSKL